MPATAVGPIRIDEPSQPEQRPYLVPDHDPSDHEVLPVHETRTEAHRSVPGRAPSAVQPPRASPISIVSDPAGQFVAEDNLGAVIGVGATPREAVADFYQALDRRLAFLRTHRDQLHPGLLRELGALERLFPGR
jgi:hypothetical protein